MKFDLQNKDGLTLKTKGKYVREDIAVGLSESDKSALVPENMVEEASVLGVQGSLKKYDGSYEGATDKWWGEDFINSLYNEYQQDGKVVNVFLLNNIYDEIEFKGPSNGYGSVFYFSDGEVINYNHSNNKYKKTWDTTKDIILSGKKVRYLVWVKTNNSYNYEVNELEGYSFRHTIIGCITYNYGSVGYYDTYGNKNDYWARNLEFMDIRACTTSWNDGSKGVNLYGIFDVITHLRLPKEAEWVNLFEVTPPKIRKTVLDTVLEYKIRYWQKSNSSGSRLNGWIYDKYPKEYKQPYSQKYFINNTQLIDLKQAENILNDLGANWFENCYKLLTTSNLLLKFKPQSIYYSFYNCYSLKDVELNLLNCTNTQYAFQSCYMLTNLKLLNIKTNIQIGSGTSWGTLLTLESLLHTCQECIDTGSSLTLTVGSANITKLADVYVKLTGEAEEDETLPKLPMVQCESTDEGAMTIQDYLALKNWTIA